MSKFLNKHPKLQTFYRKRVLSLKRNYYTLPFTIVCISVFFFLCCLFILNKSVGRCDYKLTAVYLFIAVLASILSIVALINYTKKVYGQKRPLKMLIIYYVIIVICITFTIMVFVYNEIQIGREIVKRDAVPSIIIEGKEVKPQEWYTYQTYINYGKCSRALLIVFFVFEIIANGLLIAGPKLEKELAKVHFDNLTNNEEKQTTPKQ